MPSPLLTSVRRRAPLLVLAAIVLAGCKGSEPTPTTAGPADIGGTMVIASPADAGGLLPILVTSNVERQVTDLLYDRLAEIGTEMVTVGDKGFKPQLAEKWDWAP